MNTKPLDHLAANDGQVATRASKDAEWEYIPLTGPVPLVIEMVEPNPQTCAIAHIYPTAVWIEDDICGGRHVMLQHEGMHPFCYASFHYDYAYTSNGGTHHAAHQLAASLGYAEPIEHRPRQLVQQDDEDMAESLEAAIEYFGAERLAQALAKIGATK